MSELSKQLREEYTWKDGHDDFVQPIIDPNVIALCDEHERLEAEHARVCNEHALLVQESGREGRELDRLEGLLRAWGESGEAWRNGMKYSRWPAKQCEIVYAEAVRLAKEKP